MSVEKDVRWVKRFNNFTDSFTLLEKAVGENNLSQLNDLEKTGLIHLFQMSYELAWKTLNDKIEHDGLTVPPPGSPKAVLRFAYNRKYIDSIDGWLEMVNDRNLITHTYESKVFDTILPKIKSDHYPLLRELHQYFIKEQSD